MTGRQHAGTGRASIVLTEPTGVFPVKRVKIVLVSRASTALSCAPNWAPGGSLTSALIKKDGAEARAGASEQESICYA